MNLLYAKGWQRKKNTVNFEWQAWQKILLEKIFCQTFHLSVNQDQTMASLSKNHDTKKDWPGKGFLRGQVILIYLRDWLATYITRLMTSLLGFASFASTPLALTQLTCGKSAYSNKQSKHLILPLMQTIANI